MADTSVQKRDEKEAEAGEEKNCPTPSKSFSSWAMNSVNDFPTME